MLDIIKEIVGLYGLISDQIGLVKINEARCKRLGERIGIVVNILQCPPHPLTNSPEFMQALRYAKNVLQECLRFIKEFSTHGWCKKFFKGGDDRKAFDGLNEQLQQAMELLSLGINISETMNREKDRADEAKDREALAGKLDEMQKLLEEEFCAQAGARAKQGEMLLEQKEQQMLMLQHLQSIHERLQSLGTVPSAAITEPYFNIPFYELDFDRVLAAGSLGTIYLGKWNKEIVTIKRLEGELSESEHQKFIKEIKLLSHLSHRHIALSYGACLEKGRYCLVMEYVAQGSLFNAVERVVFTLEQKQRLALEIALGLNYLHRKGVVHCNLKSSNVLLDENLHAKITDFGLARIRNSDTFGSLKSDERRSNDAVWLAPERCLRGIVAQPAVDIYSYGVILWELMTGKHPKFDADIKCVEALADVPKVYAEVIRQCCSNDPSERPSLDFIIERIAAELKRPASPSGEELCSAGIVAEKEMRVPEAYECYLKASAKGSMRAQVRIGIFFAEGRRGVVRPDKPSAYQAFLKAANAGDKLGQYNLALMLERGDGVPRDLPQALMWYQKAAAGGDERAARKVVALGEKLKKEHEGLVEEEKTVLKQ